MSTMKTGNTPTNCTQQKALAAFLTRTQACRALVAKISAHLDDHTGLDPDDVHWGDVGSTAHIQGLLEQICDFSGIDTAGIDRISPVER